MILRTERTIMRRTEVVINNNNSNYSNGLKDGQNRRFEKKETLT